MKGFTRRTVLAWVCGTILTPELFAVGTSGIRIDDWPAEIHCDSICMDLNWSATVDEEDFLVVVASCGTHLGPSEDDAGAYACVEGAFAVDGYVDIYDVWAWDWALKDIRRVAAGGNCRMSLPLTAADPCAAGPRPVASLALPSPVQADPLALPGELLIMGKSRYRAALSDLVTDCFGLFDGDAVYTVDYVAPLLPTRCNVRVVRGTGGEVYAVNSELGIVRIDGPVKTMIPPGEAGYPREPRYESPAAVYIGIQGEGASSFGRPILDAAFGNEGAVYVVPVVVQPTGHDPYLAGARLRRREGANPPYDVVQLYDNPPLAGDNQHRNHLREIEVDGVDTVYILDVYRYNESCIVWKYGKDGILLKRLNLVGPESSPTVEDPLAMHVSSDGRTLYLASGQRAPEHPDRTVLYGLSTDDFSLVRSITIAGMHLVSSVSEDSATGTLWVVGFSTPQVPQCPNPTAEPFYQPDLAKVPADVDAVWAIGISDPLHGDLALPVSVLWVGE